MTTWRLIYQLEKAKSWEMDKEEFSSRGAGFNCFWGSLDITNESVCMVVEDYKAKAVLDALNLTEESAAAITNLCTTTNVAPAVRAATQPSGPHDATGAARSGCGTDPSYWR